MEIFYTEDIKKLFRHVKNFFLDLLTINGGIYFYTRSHQVDIEENFLLFGPVNFQCLSSYQ